MEDFSIPNIKTTIRIGGFTLYAYAYRKLSKSECNLAVQQYLRNCKLKAIPKSGSGKIITIFGGIQ